MTREERNTKLKAFITCLKCELSGKCCDDNCSIQYDAGNMGEIIENLEAISKALEKEPKTGHWIERHDDWGCGIITNKRYKCSVCHGKHIDPETGEWHEVFDYKYPFCPNCGAKMVEPQESEDKE